MGRIGDLSFRDCDRGDKGVCIGDFGVTIFCFFGVYDFDLDFIGVFDFDLIGDFDFF